MFDEEMRDNNLTILWIHPDIMEVSEEKQIEYLYLASLSFDRVLFHITSMMEYNKVINSYDCESSSYKDMIKRTKNNNCIIMLFDHYSQWNIGIIKQIRNFNKSCQIITFPSLKLVQ